MIEPRVSVIITAYNSEAFIADAIQSVLNQTRAADEIVVIDDGSIDSTRRVVSEFADQGIKFIQQGNHGSSAARNKGIRETSGEYIAFLDADDIWLENKIRLQVGYLNAHPKAAIVSGFAKRWNTTRGTTREQGKILPNMNILRREILVRNVLGNASMVMVRRSALQGVGLFNEDIRWGQDWELWQRLVQQYDAGIVPELVTIYRWHKDNLSFVRRWARLISEWNIASKAIRQSEPAWRRPWLLARAWSDFTYRRATYAIQFAFPRWRHIWYALPAFLVYPFETTRGKFGTLVHAVVGEQMYQTGKRVVRSRLPSRGPR